MLTNALKRRLLAAKKKESPVDLDGWGGRELCSFLWMLGWRVVRGALVRVRLGACAGWVLAEKNVRLYHARHIRAGRRLNLEEGCEIVGLSKQGIVFGDRCTVGRLASIRPTNVLIDEPGEGMRMGDHSNIGSYCYVGCSGFVSIGSGVMMGQRVNLLAENHNHERIDLPMKDQGVTRGSIIIEDDCWLGAGCSVLAGVRVGHGSIIAAGAVVTKDVPPLSIVAGVPARVVRQREAT